MKKLLTIMVSLLSINFSAAAANAQGAPRPEKSPITEITKAFESSPDMLNETLKKVKRLESTAKVPEDTSADDTNPDTFKNPFIPQTPQPIKDISDDNIKKPVETVTRVKPTVPIPQFTLSGLIWNTKKPAAILNGKIVAVGDQVSSWSVSEITKEGVHVTFEDLNLWVKPNIDFNRNKAAQPNQRNY